MKNKVIFQPHSISLRLFTKIIKVLDVMIEYIIKPSNYQICLGFFIA
jgi:hypothetical protein